MRFWCLNGNLGYDQNQRWDIRVGGECDCSSLVIHCLHEAGFDTGNSSYTGNMSAALCARGWKRLPANGNPHAGDILLADATHVAVYLGNGLLAQASIDERGKARGGRSGDQTNHETNVRSYYSHPWNCYLRYTDTQTINPTTSGDDEMPYVFCYVSENFPGVKFFDGTRIHNLTNPDELAILKTTFAQTTGKQLPILTIGQKKAPWNIRFEDAIHRAG
jgi:cell wall-associated NlpC family hydrolase